MIADNLGRAGGSYQGTLVKSVRQGQELAHIGRIRRLLPQGDAGGAAFGAMQFDAKLLTHFGNSSTLQGA